VYGVARQGGEAAVRVEPLQGIEEGMAKQQALMSDLPKGVLPARSKTVTRVRPPHPPHHCQPSYLKEQSLMWCAIGGYMKVTFQPNAASDYDFAMLANLRTVDADGVAVSFPRQCSEYAQDPLYIPLTSPPHPVGMAVVPDALRSRAHDLE
jgi:hypothetical protein